MFNLTPIVKNILIINCLLFFLPFLLGNDRIFVDWLGLRYVLSPNFSPYQIVTHMFMHANISHLLYNMLGLMVFGPMLEMVWGPKRFLLFYMVCGLGAGVLYSLTNYIEVSSYVDAASVFLENPSPETLTQFWFDKDKNMLDVFGLALDKYSKDPQNINYAEQFSQVVTQTVTTRMNTPMIGASGAVFGILMAFGLLFPNTELMLLFPPIPIKAKFVVGFYGLTAIYGALYQAEGDNVAHYAHLGGMIFGAIFVYYWRKNRHNFY